MGHAKKRGKSARNAGLLSMRKPRSLEIFFHQDSLIQTGGNLPAKSESVSTNWKVTLNARELLVRSDGIVAGEPARVGPSSGYRFTLNDLTMKVNPENGVLAGTANMVFANDYEIAHATSSDLPNSWIGRLLGFDTKNSRMGTRIDVSYALKRNRSGKSVSGIAGVSFYDHTFRVDADFELSLKVNKDKFAKAIVGFAKIRDPKKLLKEFEQAARNSSLNVNKDKFAKAIAEFAKTRDPKLLEEFGEAGRKILLELLAKSSSVSLPKVEIDFQSIVWASLPSLGLSFPLTKVRAWAAVQSRLVLRTGDFEVTRGSTNYLAWGIIPSPPGTIANSNLVLPSLGIIAGKRQTGNWKFNVSKAGDWGIEGSAALAPRIDTKAIARGEKGISIIPIYAYGDVKATRRISDNVEVQFGLNISGSSVDLFCPADDSPSNSMQSNTTGEASWRHAASPAERLRPTSDEFLDEKIPGFTGLAYLALRYW